jgi:glycerol kinase
MQADAKIRLRELRVDGGATTNNALLQFQSDLLRVPVVRPRTTETTALGAAYLAGLAVGFWKNRAEIARLWAADRTFRPKAAPAVMRRLQTGWHRAVARAKSQA